MVEEALLVAVLGNVGLLVVAVAVVFVVVVVVFFSLVMSKLPPSLPLDGPHGAYSY